MSSRDLILAALWRHVPAWAIDTMIARFEEVALAPILIRRYVSTRSTRAYKAIVERGIPTNEEIAGRVVERSLEDFDAGRLPRSLSIAIDDRDYLRAEACIARAA